LNIDRFTGSYIVADVCMHNSDNINNCELVPEEARYSIVLLLEQFAC